MERRTTYIYKYIYIYIYENSTVRLASVGFTQARPKIFMKQLRAGICMAVVLRPRLLTFACLARHPANCFTALPKVFSSVPMHQNSYVGVKPGRSPCGLHKLWPTLVHEHIAILVGDIGK